MVRALQALRGVSFVTAVGLVAEIGDIRRFSIRASSWRFSVWCRRSIRVGRASDAAGSPRRATARAPPARRSRMGVSGHAAPRTADALSTRGVAEACLRHRLEGPAAPDVTLSTTGRARQVQAESRHGDRSRADRLHLGDRAGGASAARVDDTSDPVRPVGGIAARWRTLEVVMDISRSIRPCLGRGSSATNHSLGGTQPADISSVNRR